MLSLVALYLVSFPLFFLLMRRVPDTTADIAIPPKRGISLGWFFVILLMGYGITYFFSYTTNLISGLVDYFLSVPFADPLTDLVTSAYTPFDYFIVALQMVGVAPLLEELVFRKYFYHKLIGYGPHLYILLSSIFFMSLHTNLFQMNYAFTLGLILSAIYVYTRKFLYVWALHFLINIGSVITMILSGIPGTTAQFILEVYSVVLLSLSCVGFVLLIAFLFSYRKKYSFGYGAPLPIKSALTPLLNPGMIALYSYFFLSIMFAQVSSALIILLGS
jgi:membrane protease YdiL (CAAX protease family)